MKIETRNDGLDDLLQTIDMIRKCIPSDLKDCRDIDFETLAISFRKMFRVNYNLSVSKDNFCFGISDGQEYNFEVMVRIVDGDVFTKFNWTR